MSTGTDRRPASADKVDRSAGTKRTTVDFVSKQAEEQVVTGVVMVPHEVDRQGDFEEPETIETFADQFASLYESGSADGGIMHAAWPSEWMDLAANGVVGKVFPEDAPIPDDIDTFTECTDWAEEQDDIDDPDAFCGEYHIPEDVAEGAWFQSWRVNDDGLWQLIQDDVIEGFSIGARDVSWRGPIEQADLPEGVGLPEEYPEDEPVWELEDGVIREVSAVDTPAVPQAMIHAKADEEKRLDEYLADRDAFIEEAQQRGHSEAEAERLWDVLSRASEIDGAGEPGQKGFFERIGKAVHRAFSAGSDQTRERHETREKEGRTLSKQNRDSLMATVDAGMEVLEDAGELPDDMTRFTDREDTDFNLSEHEARAFDTATQPDDDDTETETDTDTESMSDTNETDTDDGSKDADGDPFKDAPEWAVELKDTVEANSEQIEDLTEEDKDADADADGDADKDADGDDAPEWAKALTEQVEANAEAIESIGKQSGFSTQVSGNGDADKDGEPEDQMGQIKDALS